MSLRTGAHTSEVGHCTRLPMLLCVISCGALHAIRNNGFCGQNHFFRLKYQTSPATTSADTATTAG